MNLKIASAVFIAAVAGSAFAEGPILPIDPFMSTTSRAEVQAELMAFKRAGADPWAQDYNQLASFRSERSRREVMAEYIADRERVTAVNSEDSGSQYFAMHPQGERSGTTLAGQPLNPQ